MAITTEVLNATLRDLKDPRINTFAQNNPFTKHVFKANGIAKSSGGGTYIERPLMTGATTTFTGIFGGFELMNATRTQRSIQVKVEPHRIVGLVTIPEIELDQNSGPLAAFDIAKRYLNVNMDSYERCLESFFLTGLAPAVGNHVLGAAEMAGLLTLNGLYSTGVRTGTEAGLLDFEAPSIQGDTVQNIAKSQGTFYYNQYAAVSSYASNGRKKIRALIRLVQQHSGEAKIGFVDPDTFSNMDEEQQSHVRVTVGSADDGGKGGETSLCITEKGVMFYESLDMDRTRTGFAGTALANGGGYVLSPETFELHERSPLKMGDYSDRFGLQDVVAAKVSQHLGMVCVNPIANGCFSGSAL
jgi:hypothetical protein